MYMPMDKIFRMKPFHQCIKYLKSLMWQVSSIIQLISRLEAGEKSLEQVRGQIHTLLLNSRKSTALTELLQEWTA